MGPRVQGFPSGVQEGFRTVLRSCTVSYYSGYWNDGKLW